METKTEKITDPITEEMWKETEKAKSESFSEETADLSNVESLLESLIRMNNENNELSMSLIINCLNEMKEAFFEVQNELNTVTKQLSQVQDTPQVNNSPKLSVVTEIVKVQVTSFQEEIEEIKRNLNDKAAQLVLKIKENGTVALKNACEFLSIKELAEKLKLSLKNNATKMQDNMEKIDKVSQELKEASTHIKNVGRALDGKEQLPVPMKDRKGILYQLNSSFQLRKDCCLRHAEKLDYVINKIEQLDRKTEKEKSKKCKKAKSR